MPIDPSTSTLTLLALVAFASNSILTRLAIGGMAIDAASFTAIRLASGAVALSLAVRATTGSWSPLRQPSLLGPASLIVYAIPFSFAYLRIGAAVGALVLFGSVQLTMVAYGIWRGERPLPLAWVGLLLATGGLSLLALRSPSRPDPLGVALMSLAGVAWGAYSIAGRTSTNPVAANAWSFLLSAPIAVLLALAGRAGSDVTLRGVGIALLSGVVASGGGYIVWYRAVRRLAVTQAAVAQLSVPVIAAFGAVVLLGEAVSVRLIASGAAVLGGIALVLVSRLEPFR